ncbi:thioesterase family protein [Nocardioides sp.]|uniref:thioesterase family protein n=1 Tax=Nocardioides sp. TaxID=35761 RepID=UPI00351273BA
MSYFRRLGPHRFLATAATGGAWAVEEQHIAPALGLLAHAVAQDQEQRGRPGLVMARLSYDILGTVAIGEVEVAVEVVRPGRTIDLVQARLSASGRDVVRARVWLLEPRDSAGTAGTPVPTMPPPEALPAWDPTTLWVGGFIASVQVRREDLGPGRARVWVRTPLPLVAEEPVAEPARLIGLLDIANGMAVRADPREVAYPNVDLTVHLTRRPVGEWLGLDTTVTFGADGLGLTSSVVHDLAGPLGTCAQALTVRPR